MKIWVIANQKGGVGKTTSAVSLCGWLSHQEQRTLLVDLDPHGSLTAYFGLNPDVVSDGVYTLFQGCPVILPSLLRPTRVPYVNLLPASTAMATLDRQLGAQEGMGLVLMRALAQVSERFDYVILDCPATVGVLMINALAAAQRLIIPVQTEFLALKGLERMMTTLSKVNLSTRRRMSYLIVPTMFDQRTQASRAALRTLRQHYGEHLWGGTIPLDTRFRDASLQGLPLPLINADARGSVAYDLLLDALVGVETTVACGS